MFEDIVRPSLLNLSGEESLDRLLSNGVDKPVGRDDNLYRRALTEGAGHFNLAAQPFDQSFNIEQTQADPSCGFDIFCAEKRLKYLFNIRLRDTDTVISNRDFELFAAAVELYADESSPRRKLNAVRQQFIDNLF